MGFLFVLLDNPYVPWVVGLGALFLAYRFLADACASASPASPSGREDLLSRILGPRFAEKKLEREVARLKKQDNYLAAGKLLEDVGPAGRGGRGLPRGPGVLGGGVHPREAGQGRARGRALPPGRRPQEGGGPLHAAGKPARAAALFLEKGNTLEAARLFGLAGQWGTAAELYEKSGYPLRAAEAWEKDGKPLKAAEAYEKHFMENVSFSTTYSSTASPADQKSALLAGRLYEKAGELDRAVAVYTKGGYFKEAAEALLRLGQPAKAAELFMRAEDHESAADAFEQAGDACGPRPCGARWPSRPTAPPRPRPGSCKGRDYLRAAELFESVGMLAEAAGAYEAGESWAAAGGVYIRAGLKDRAAAAYEKAGELETAAKLYEKSGTAPARPSSTAAPATRSRAARRGAGRRAREGDRPPAARGPRGRELPRRRPSCWRGSSSRPAGPALAMERVQKAIGGEAVSAANLDLYYWLALAHEAAGAPAEALALYKKIQAEDLRFRDVNERVGAPVGRGARGRARPAPRPRAAPPPPAPRRRRPPPPPPPAPRASSRRRRSRAARWARSGAARTRPTAAASRCA